MACFLVPAGEAIITTAITKLVKHNEKTSEVKASEVSEENKEPFSRKLERLNGLLWGGSALLAFEHLWHGEIVPFFPFLTAADDPAELVAVFGEMATVGVGMAVIITGAWAVMTFVMNRIAVRDTKTAKNYR